MKTVKLFIDDLRQPPDDSWTVTRSYQETIDYILVHGLPSTVSFDHDLGLEETGYDIAKWIVEKVLDKEVDIPDDFAYKIHSANPVGAKNIHSLLSNFLNFIHESETTR